MKPTNSIVRRLWRRRHRNFLRTSGYEGAEVIHEEAVGLPCDYADGSSSGGSAPTTRPRTRRSWPRPKMAGPTRRRTRPRTRLGARTDGAAGAWLATHGP